MKYPFWETDWQNIKFTSLDVPLKLFRRASADFYSAFYSELFKNYNTYDELPLNWKKEKSDTAQELLSLIDKRKSVLSIGSGLGYVEKEIVSYAQSLTIDAYDFTDTAFKWLGEVDRVNALTSLSKTSRYQFIYCTQLIYALSDSEIIELAELVRNHLDHSGLFVTIDSSSNPTENGGLKSPRSQIKKILKIIFSPLYYLLFKNTSAQFWGWQRNNDEIISHFKKKGMIVEKTFSAVGQSFIVFKSDNTF